MLNNLGVLIKLRWMPNSLVLLFAIIFFVYQYGSYLGVPGNSADYPLGWWGWADQGEYLKSTRNILSGQLKPELQFYPPLYPALAIAFLPFTEMHAYLPLTIILYAIYLCAFMTTFGSEIGRWAAALAIGLGLFQYQLLTLQWVVPWTSSLAAALEMFALLLFHRFLSTRFQTSQIKRDRIVNAALCGGAIGLLASVRPVDFLAFMPLLLSYAGIVMKDFVVDRNGTGRGAIAVLISGVVFALLPVVGYLGFNIYLFGEALGGYFSAVEKIGGFAFQDIFDRSFSHLIDARALYAEDSADWKSTLPDQLFFLCFVPLTIFFGSPFLRVVAVIVFCHLVAVYSYADALPTGQFRYYNIHYFKWMYPILPVFFLNTVCQLWTTCKTRRMQARVRLIGGGIFAVLVVSVYPDYQLYRPQAVTAPDEHALQITFDAPQTLDFLDIKTSEINFGQYSPHGMKVQINGHVDLKPISEQRLLPRSGGIRLLLNEPYTVRTINLSFADTGLKAIGPMRPNDIIGGRVELTLGVPWQNEPPLPEFPYQLLEPDALLEASNSAATYRYFGEGWSAFEKWGRWIDGSIASLQFELPQDLGSTAVLIMEGQPFLPSQLTEMSIDVYINGKLAGTMAFNSFGVKSFNFALPNGRDQNERQIRVDLRARKTISPADAGLSADSRQLSFGITRFGLRE